MSAVVEHELLRQAQAGDIEAYEELQILLEAPIRRFVRRMIDMGDIEDDIVQDVFIAFFMNLANIQPVENLRPYIYRIARNRCYDELRKLGRDDREMSLDDEGTQVWVSFTTANDQLQHDDATYWSLLHLEVRAAIERLPEAQRQALILYADEGMTYAEIAEIEGVSIGTIKSRVFYAKKALRGLLKPQTLAALEAEFFEQSPKQAPMPLNN